MWVDPKKTTCEEPTARFPHRGRGLFLIPAPSGQVLDMLGIGEPPAAAGAYTWEPALLGGRVVPGPAARQGRRRECLLRVRCRPWSS
jgi:hypothetical protein